MIRAALFLLLLVWPAAVRAGADLEFEYRQRIGAQLPLDATFADQQGHAVRLRDVAGVKPLILALGYFHCPNLCGFLREDLHNALTGNGLNGHDYTVVVLSIDPAETAADANIAAEQDASRFGDRPGWIYLTGRAEELETIESAVGFKTRFDAEAKQFLHPAGLVFLTPQARVSSYLLGLGYQPDAVRNAVELARAGGTRPASPILLLCFHFDPVTGRYTFAVTTVLKIVSILTVAAVGALIGRALLRQRHS